MLQLDKDTLDYVRANIEAQVRQNVESSLFRQYIKLIGFFMAGVGVVGVPWSCSYIDKQVTTAVADQVTKQVSVPAARAAELVKETVAATQAARDAAAKAMAQFDAQRDLVDKNQAHILSKSSQINDDLVTLKAQIETRRDLVTKELARVTKEVQDIENQTRSMAARQLDERGDPGAVTQLSVDLKSLAEQLKRLDEAVSALAVRVKQEDVLRQSPVQASVIQSVVDASRVRVESAREVPKTVYIQFHQMSRETAKALSARLASSSWTIPGEERLDAARGKHEVRCYYDTDCQAAQRLQADAEQSLRLLGFPAVDVTVKDFSKTSRKPRQGVLELWLGMEDPPSRR